MKVIFLDVDGVLNSIDGLMEYRQKNNITKTILYDEVEEKPLMLLKKIVEETGAFIVLSSTWRIGKNTKNEHIGRLYQKIEAYLLINGMMIYDTTPILNNQRGEEIKEWLKDNFVEDFVILDDDSDMCDLTPHLIKTSYEHGLTEALALNAINYLNRDRVIQNENKEVQKRLRKRH